MASASRTLLYAVSQFLILLLLLLIHESRSCPDSFSFYCPDNVHIGEFPISNFTNSSLRDQHCGRPCELTCDYSNQTMIKCTENEETPYYQVLYINPNNGTIVVDSPDWRLPPDGLEFPPCRAYLDLHDSFPTFQFVNLTTRGKYNETFFLGCPYPREGDDYWDSEHHYIECGGDYGIVYGPYDYGNLPAGKTPPAGCIQFPNLSPTDDNKNKGPDYYDFTMEGPKGRLAHVLEIALPSVGFLAGLIIGLCFCLRRKKSPANLSVEAFLRSYGTLAPQRYSYSDIKKMTNSFKEKVGQGGFGAVYKGRLVDGRLVAVKLLKQSKGDNGEEFINEVASIGRTNHVNIATLQGFCFERSKRALVYEFMPNGSLEKFTRAAGDQNDGAQSLTWQTMFEISLGIARGLEYLHRGCQTRILHFDIKPHNILLDENFRPKISDFGLAKLYPQDKQSKVSMSVARGTIGYIAPEVFCRSFGDVSHKSDVYSYGMMVLEVIGSRKRENDGGETENSDLYFPHWIYKQLDREAEVDELGRDEEKEVKRKLILVSLWCIQTVPSSRPSMSRVVQMLEARLDTIEIPPMPILSSPPRSNLYPSGSESCTITL